MTESSEYKQFWKWFADHAASLRESATDSLEVFSELDKAIRGVGVPAWEIVPPETPDRNATLVLSGGGDTQQVARCNEIVAAAPAIPGWEFATSKPRKAWQRKFSWPGVPGIVDASEWRFQVLAYPDGMFELILLSDIGLPLSAADRRRAAIFAIESELGETLCRQKVCRIAVEEELETHTTGSVRLADLYGVVTRPIPSRKPSSLN